MAAGGQSLPVRAALLAVAVLGDDIEPNADALDGAVTMSLEADVFRAWIMRAPPGLVLAYAVGAVPPRRRQVWHAARAAREAGLVQLSQRRLPDGRTEYLATRLRGPIAIDDPKRPELRVFAELDRCADAGEPMPTDAALRLRCGLKSADQASYALRLLRRREAGARRVEIINWGPREHRQCLIVATGAMTPRKVFE
jgi:hypothetical protein